MKQQNIRVATAAYPIAAHQKFAAWQAHTAAWVDEAAKAGAQLLVFPEYGSMELLSTFPTDVQASVAQSLTALEPLHDDFCMVFADLAKQFGCVIVAPSLPVRVGEEVWNRAYVCSLKGVVGYQDKFFMTRFEDEEWGVRPSAKQLTVFEADWGNFGIQICYDVEFGLGSGQLCAAGAQLIVVPSCTERIRGATRVHVGARARALENQCFVAVAQTVGEAPWSPIVDVNYGYAAFYSAPDTGLPEEGVIAMGMPQVPGWLIQDLDLALIEAVRRDGQVFNFKDQARVRTEFVGEEVVVMRVRV
jgi:predicted amidohydrolase